jgi:hypothetical protein
MLLCRACAGPAYYRLHPGLSILTTAQPDFLSVPA